MSNTFVIAEIDGSVTVEQSDDSKLLVTAKQGEPGPEPWLVDGSAVTQPVSIDSLPLPLNAAQETGGNLATLAGKDFATQTTLYSLATSITDGNQKTEISKWIGSTSPTVGQKASSSSIPVVLPSDQATETSPLGIRLTDGSAFYTGVKTGQLPTTLGQTTSTNSISVALASDQATTSAPLSTQVTVSGYAVDPRLVTIQAGSSTIGAVTAPGGADLATAAKQPAIGSPGVASVDVISVQGVTSMTPLKTDGSGVTQPVSGTVTANIGTTNGLALDSSLGTINTTLGTPAQEHTAANSPASFRLTDGSSFYKATTPSDTQPISVASLPLPTGAATDRTTAASPASVRISDGSSFVNPTQIRTLTASDVVTVQGSALTSSPWSTAAIGNLSSGDTTIVAGAGGQTIKVYGWSFGVAAAANVTLYDGAAGTAKTGAYPLVANQGIAAGPRLEPLFVCSTGNALVINSSAAVSAGGIVWYVRS